jgi:hypothetical protein
MLRTRSWALACTILRLIAALVVAAAIVAQGISTIGDAAASGQHVPTVTVNFFSFFTILSNTATVLVLAWSAIARMRPGRLLAPDPRGLTPVFACVTTYMLITGVVYNVLLRATSIGPDTVGWANEVMHVAAPLFLLLDLLVGYGRRGVRWRVAPAAAVFPLAWIVYTLVRAPLVTAPSSGAPSWYPYPFLDPNGPGGWPSVWVYIVGIAAGIVVVAFGVVAVLRIRARSDARRPGSPVTDAGDTPSPHGIRDR